MHPDLVAVVKEAGKHIDFTVIQGLRTLEEQKRNVLNGKSQTMKSRHLTGHAVDLAVWQDGKLVWGPWSRYQELAKVVLDAAHKLKIPVTWGGDWKSLRDGPHFELPWKEYP